MNKDTKKMLGTACVIGGIFLTYYGCKEERSSAAEIAATNGTSSMTLSIPGIALAGYGLFLLFKKD